MIKKYNQYIKESLLDKLHGPSEDELISKFKNKKNLLLRLSIENHSIEGIKIAIKMGADIDEYLDDYDFKQYMKSLNIFDVFKTLKLDKKIKPLIKSGIKRYLGKTDILNIINVPIKMNNFLRDYGNIFDVFIGVEFFKSGKIDKDIIETYLYSILYCMSKENIKYLLDNGIDINFGNGVLLRKACKEELYDIFDFLIKNGVDINNQIYDGIIFIPSINGDYKMVKKILDLGYKIEINNSLLFNRIIHEAFDSRRKDEYIKILDLFIENGANIDYVYAINSAVNHVDEKMIEFLIKKGADINTITKRNLDDLNNSGYKKSIKNLLNKYKKND